MLGYCHRRLVRQLGSAMSISLQDLVPDISTYGAISQYDIDTTNRVCFSSSVPKNLHSSVQPGTVSLKRCFSSQRQGGLQLEVRGFGVHSLVVDDAALKQLVQSAFREKQLSFGFSGGGCLFPYYIGVVEALREKGVLADGVKVAGASAGSLIAVCHQSGMNIDQITEQTIRYLHNLRVGGARGRMGGLLKSFLLDSLPQDAHHKCQDLAYVAITKVVPYPHLQLVADFQSRTDLIQALMASCHIPYYLNGQAYTDFRGRPSIDGGFTKFIPLAPRTVGIRICCFPSKQLNPYYRIGISPDNFERWPYTLGQMIQFSFDPGSETFVSELIRKGSLDAQAWIEEMELDIKPKIKEGHLTQQLSQR